MSLRLQGCEERYHGVLSRRVRATHAHAPEATYSSAVHSSPEPSGSEGLIARHMMRKAPIATVATIRTVLMTDIVHSGRGCVVVWGDRKFTARFVPKARVRTTLAPP
jgi:hypothetical protein